MVRKSKKEIPEESGEFTVSSGNVYADLGFPNAEEYKAKADLARFISGIIEEKNITQEEAAQLMGIDQPKVSKITRGILSDFTLERLMKFLVSLGYDVEVKAKRHTMKNTSPMIYINTDKNTSRRFSV